MAIMIANTVEILYAPTVNAFSALPILLKGLAVGFRSPQWGHLRALVLISLPQVLHGFSPILSFPPYQMTLIYVILIVI